MKSLNFQIRISVTYNITASDHDKAMLEAQDRFQNQVDDKSILDKHLLEFVRLSVTTKNSELQQCNIVVIIGNNDCFTNPEYTDLIETAMILEKNILLFRRSDIPLSRFTNKWQSLRILSDIAYTDFPNERNHSFVALLWRYNAVSSHFIIGNGDSLKWDYKQ